MELVEDKSPSEKNKGENKEEINDQSPGYKEDTKDFKHQRLIDRILDSTDFSPINLRIYIIALFFLLADGGEMVVLSLLTDILQIEWGLTDTQKGLLGSSVFIGLFIGTLLAGKLSDKFGRKPIFIVGALIVSGFGVTSALSNSFGLFIMFRSIFGVGVGLSIPSITSLAAEISSNKWRGWIVNGIWIFFPIGEILAVIEGKYLLNGLKNGWRILLVLAAIPCLLIFFISFFVCESPRFLLSKEKYEDSFVSLNYFLKSAGLSLLTESDKERIISENKEEISKSNFKSDFSELCKLSYLRLTCLICLIFFMCSFVYYGMINIQPQILKNSDSQEDYNKMYNSVIFASIAEIPSTILTSFLVNIPFLGRIRTLLIGFSLAFIVSLLSYFNLSNASIYFTLLKFSISISFGTISVYAAEAFPTKFRTIGYAVSTSFTRIGGVVTPVFNQITFAYDRKLPFINFFVGSFLGFIGAYLLPFETLGREIL